MTGGKLIDDQKMLKWYTFTLSFTGVFSELEETESIKGQTSNRKPD